MSSIRRAGAALWLAALCACAPTTSGSPGSSTSRTIIDRAEIEASNLTDAFTLVQARRPQWLELRGPGSLSSRVARLIYVDDSMLGELDALRQINVTLVRSIRYWDGPSATQKWGSNHGGGVIQIVTR